jgi:hypothetical protein
MSKEDYRVKIMELVEKCSDKKILRVIYMFSKRLME